MNHKWLVCKTGTKKDLVTTLNVCFSLLFVPFNSFFSAATSCNNWSEKPQQKVENGRKHRYFPTFSLLHKPSTTVITPPTFSGSPPAFSCVLYQFKKLVFLVKAFPQNISFFKTSLVTGLLNSGIAGEIPETGYLQIDPCWYVAILPNMCARQLVERH